MEQSNRYKIKVNWIIVILSAVLFWFSFFLLAVLGVSSDGDFGLRSYENAFNIYATIYTCFAAIVGLNFLKFKLRGGYYRRYRNFYVGVAALLTLIGLAIFFYALSYDMKEAQKLFIVDYLKIIAPISLLIFCVIYFWKAEEK